MIIGILIFMIFIAFTLGLAYADRDTLATVGQES